ncbi:MAG: exodeoxyribonuclease III [Alphaproteobacteria bacterium]|nr:exodeoxyribonuclease III [Alphaproteobacteria bacterium]
MAFRTGIWNVNSVKARLPHLLDWLKRDMPEIVLLQETKCTDDAFPAMELEELGYNLALHGEKSYNGVAILSKFPLEDVRRGLPGEDQFGHARYIEAVANLPGRAVRVASVYVPNGQNLDSDKFPYKLHFLERLGAHLLALLAYEEMLIVGGDYNVAPYPADVYDPARLDGNVCYHPEERARIRAILHLGFYDGFRLINPPPEGTHGGGEYTFWDYRAASFEANRGWRIDYPLLSPQAADALRDCVIVKTLRGLDKPSDHAPLLASFADAREG